METLTQTVTSRRKRSLETRGMQLCRGVHPDHRALTCDHTYCLYRMKILALCSLSIYEKLIQFCGIDELGTNYPKDMFDPHGWSEDSYYEALGKPSLCFFSCSLTFSIQLNSTLLSLY